MHPKCMRNGLAGWLFPLHLLLLANLGVAQAEAAEQKLFFWKTSSEKATVYLLGSIHVAKAGIYPLNSKIEKAFAEADRLVVEANLLENPRELAEKMQAKARYPKGDGLDRHISQELFKATAERMAKLGIPGDQLLSMKPWFISMVLMLAELGRLGVLPQNGIDMHFLQQAQDKKTIEELEGAEAQLDLMDHLDRVEQEQILRFTEKDLANLANHFDEMVNLWSQGDTSGLASLLFKAVIENPELQPIFEKLFDDRNKAMTAKIESYLKTDRIYFIVVGAGHLVGEHGIIKLLAPHFSVQQISP